MALGCVASSALWGTGKALQLPPVPSLVPKGCPQAWGTAEMWGCAEPQPVKLQAPSLGSRAQGLPLAGVTYGVAFGVSKGRR